ncbi:hypothetical protein VPH35_086976 [Triticum aestivum]
MLLSSPLFTSARWPSPSCSLTPPCDGPRVGARRRRKHAGDLHLVDGNSCNQPRWGAATGGQRSFDGWVTTTTGRQRGGCPCPDNCYNNHGDQMFEPAPNCATTDVLI